MEILIAEDSVVSRHLLDATLRKWGYDVVVACDGTEAWGILQHDNAPTIAILDWMMPGMTGPEVCQLVRQRANEPYTYILLLTSKSLKEDLIEGMESGADDYITKPFDQHELKARLHAGKRIIDLHAQLVKAREALREQATKDSLTKLWNRGSVLETLQRELSRAEREVIPVGVVLLDLDNFKQINDTNGHFAGDEVLREAARRLESTVRPYDAVGRYGGEEFLVILPGCDESCTVKQAERMRVALNREPVQIGESRVTVTASFGATTAKIGTGCLPEALIRTADDALYRAKRQGKNRVVFLAEIEPQPEPAEEHASDQGVLR